MMGVRAQQKEKTRRSLVEAAFSQLSAERSFASLSLREVARVAGIAPAVVEAIYGYGKVVDERYDGCAYFVERADEKALAEAARKVEAMGGSVKLVLRRLPEDA